MLSILAAATMMQASSAEPPRGAMCVQSTWGESNQISFVVPANRFNELSSKAQAKRGELKITPCKVRWDASRTKRLCDTVEEFSDDLIVSMTEVYGISPDEMCEAAKEVDALQKG